MVEMLNERMLDGYRLGQVLQEGEDGRKVILAQDPADGGSVVIKLAPLSNQLGASRSSREFSILRQLASPGIVAALGYGVSLRLGMEYLVLRAHGPSLALVLAAAADQRLPVESALAMAHAAATSAGQLHAQGWCHGDLKPGNLLCDQQGNVLLSDLEFAIRSGEHSGDQGADLHWAGTPPFLAPEIWSGGVRAQSSAADVWALGVTLYLALFGEYPFGREDPDSIRAAAESGVLPRLDELPEPLRNLLRQLLARTPADRPADGKQVAAAIARTTVDLGLYLAAGGRAFAELVASVPQSAGSPFDQATASTIRPPESGPIPGPAATYIPPLPAPPALLQPRTDLALDNPLRTVSQSRREREVGAIPPPSQPGAASRPGEDSLADLRRFFDVQSTAAPPPVSKPPSTVVPRAPRPVPQTGPAPSSPPGEKLPAGAEKKPLRRRAAARWYRRMNPDRNFPLSVVLSGRQIRIVGGSGLGITLGAKEIVLDSADPVLRIEPWFPGCLISPPQADVHCSQETTVCRFWITPLVCDDLAEACVTIRYRGQVVETLATPSKVVTRTTAKVLATLGLVTPVASKTLSVAGWDPDELLRESLPYVADWVDRVGFVQSGLLLTGGLLLAAVAYYYFTRPLMSEVEPKLLAPGEL